MTDVINRSFASALARASKNKELRISPTFAHK